MTINPFLQCLGATGINTGVSILGLYSFSSGDNTLVYNQLYTTGQHYISGTPYNNAIPMIFNGSGIQTTGTLKGSSFYQLSDIFQTDFSAVIYLNYSGCNYTGNNSQILAATALSSGAILGITPSNRLFIKTPDYAYTIPKEIGVGDFALFSVVGNRFVNFGLFSMADNTLYNKAYDEGSGIISLTDLTFGGALTYPTAFTGFSGKLNEVYLFSGALTNDSVGGCVACAFATGYTSGSGQFTYNSTQITGSYWTGISTTSLISTTQVLTSYPKVTGGTGFVYVDSGVSGSVTVGQALVPLSQNFVQTGYYPSVSLLFNTVQPMSGFLFDFYFPKGMLSGDIAEIYTYPTFNTNIGLPVNGLQYPVRSGVQIYGNGLAETSGVDFYVAFNNLMIGFDSSDLLLYDTYPATYTGPYSTGYIQTGTTGANFVNITGISGLSMTGFNYDIYLNGQKMASGINYSVSGLTLTVSGNDFQDFNDPSGAVLEIKFIPPYSGFLRSLTTVTGNQSYVSGISGFAEQVWLNGVRQFAGLDYFKTPRCSFCTGNFVNPHFSMVLYDTSVDTIGLFR